jgi:hypothetical protein
MKTATSSLLQILTGNIRNKVIIIDNFDCIYTSDKTINSTLLKILTDRHIKNIPIICISNNEIIKKIGDIKKNCKIYDIVVPTKEEIIQHITANNSRHSKKKLEHFYNISNGNMKKFFCDINRTSDEILYEDNIENDCLVKYPNKLLKTSTMLKSRPNTALTMLPKVWINLAKRPVM